MVDFLYHGTCASNFNSIKENGLRPRGSGMGNWFTNANGHPRLVYLTIDDHFVLFHCFRACLVNNTQRSLVVKVNVKLLLRSKLRPDENWFAKRRTPQGEITVRVGPKDRIKDVSLSGNSVGTWRQSLEACGLAAYRGIINPKQIVSKGFISVKDLPHYREDLFNIDDQLIRLSTMDAMLNHMNHECHHETKEQALNTWHKLIIPKITCEEAQERVMFWRQNYNQFLRNVK
jgi:hypothetical protein